MAETIPDSPVRPAQNVHPTHRLLYRGALSLPDSYMLLDGLSFTAAISNGDNDKNTSNSSGVDLLNNSLTLALESMRGRPSLHFLGSVRVADVWLDEKTAGIVSLDIHTHATLSRMFFETIFCLEGSIDQSGKSEYGLRVSLSDSDDPSASDILIYAQLPPSDSPIKDGLNAPSSSISSPEPVRLLVARILPGPPPAPVRPRPRPDDPTPRVPPSTFPFGSTKRKRDGSVGPSDTRGRLAGGKGKGKASADAEEEKLRKVRETMTRLPRPGVSSASAPARTAARANGKDGKAAEFKVPKVPQRTNSFARASPDGNALGTGQVNGADILPPEEREKSNKLIIKQAVVRCLADHSIDKQHKDFHDLYQNIYRGTCFALRSSMQTGPVDLWSVYKLVDGHAKMYVLNSEQT